MATNKVPTLLLGLGGIGCQIAQQVSDFLSDEDKKYIGVVGMDTNVEDLKALTINYVQTSDTKLVKDYLEIHPEYVEWFPLNRFTASRGMLTGAGQIRAISRLAALAAMENGKFIALNREIKRILKTREGIDFDSFNLFLVGSITGGTGAGLFLQMPYYVRHQLEGEFAIKNIRTRGMFVSADLTKDVQPSRINRDAVMVNAFACIKELNAFYSTQNLKDSENHLELEYYKKADPGDKADALRDSLIKSREQSEFGFDVSSLFNMEDINQNVSDILSNSATVPYDAFYLIEGTANRGGTGEAGLGSVISQIAKMIHTMLFTPLKSKAEGTTDNFVLQDMEGGGMNRYNSAGLCCLRYPYREMLSYVTLRWVKDLVKEEWLYLDMKVENEKKASAGRQKTDPSIRIPKMNEIYPELFEDEMRGGEGKKLGFLHEQVYQEKVNKADDGTVISMMDVCKLDAVFDRIEEDIEEIMECNALVNAKNECEINDSDYKQNETLKDEIQRVYNALKKLEKEAKNVVKSYQFRIADEFFPADKNTFDLNKKSEKNIFSLFSSVHPIVARYFTYRAMNELDERIAELESGLLTTADLHAYLDQDFYGTEKDGIQKAYEAADLYIEKLVPIIQKGKGNLNRLRADFRDMVSSQVDKFITQCEEQLAISTYKLLRTRFETLAKYYEGFFSNLEKRISLNDETIALLENSFFEDPLGEKMVYASPEAFRNAYNQFSGKADFELPASAMYAIANGVFDLAFTLLKNTNTDMTEDQKRERNDAIAKRLSDLFDTGVIATLETEVKELGSGIIDISIKQALEKEYQMQPGYLDNDPDYESKRIAYAQRKVLDAMSMATPMFAVEEKPDATEIVYLALNPESAELSKGEPDGSVTQVRLAPAGRETDDGTPCVIMDREFSKYEIVCMKTKHNYVIEELVKYRNDGEFARAYEARINNLGLQPSEMSEDSYKTVVNPHLNRFWHEEAFVMPLGVSEKRKSDEEVRKAFIYAMAWDSFFLVNTEEGKKWYFNGGTGSVPVLKAGRTIGNSYTDLLDSLKYNRRLKRAILFDSKQRTMKIKKSLDAEHLQDYIQNTVLVEDLVQSTGLDIGDENLLDIFISMYHKLDQDEFVLLFDALRAVLEEYLRKMFESDIKGLNLAYSTALMRMMGYSCVGKKAKEAQALGVAPDFNLAETAAKEQMSRIAGKRIY